MPSRASFVFLTDEVVAAHSSCAALLKAVRRDYRDVGKHVTHVALGPDDGMYELGDGRRRLTWAGLKAICRQQYAVVHGFSIRNENDDGGRRVSRRRVWSGGGHAGPQGGRSRKRGAQAGDCTGGGAGGGA